MTSGDSPEHAKGGGWAGGGYMQKKQVHKPMICCRMTFQNACVIVGDHFRCCDCCCSNFCELCLNKPELSFSLPVVSANSLNLSSRSTTFWSER